MFYYIILPFIGWIVSGTVKYLVNYCGYGRMEAKRKIGNGGFPSTHTTIISAPLAYIILSKGWNEPEVGLGCAILMITVIDATGIRRAVGLHAQILNSLPTNNIYNLRESQGHNWFEVLGGCILGFIVALLTYLIQLAFLE